MLSQHSPLWAVVFFCSTLHAQGFLTPPAPPPGNIPTAEKEALGMALFWDEQLSSSNSVACGSCHQHSAGGVDPRTGSEASRNPGPDGIFQTTDDVFGSIGLVRRDSMGAFDPTGVFAHHPQATGRQPGSAINALLAPSLFWDGRASGQFINPTTGQVSLPFGAALESQSVGPPMADLEMAHIGRTWSELTTKLQQVRPLALSSSIPTRLQNFVRHRSYPELFALAFGTSDITAERIAFAIASYERTLFSNQTPFDDYHNGNPAAMTAQELRGMDLFKTKGRCIQCHTFPTLGRSQFHYTGVRPADEDPGRFAVTGLQSDYGKLLVPGLRNTSLRAPYFRNGSADTLMAVIDFYDRGGDFNHTNKSPHIAPIGFTQAEKDDLHAFLETAVLDSRVVSGLPPFDSPTLNGGSPQVRIPFGFGTSSGSGAPPVMVFDDPALLGASLSVGIHGGIPGALAWLSLDWVPDTFGHQEFGVTCFLDCGPQHRVVTKVVLDSSGNFTHISQLPTHPALRGQSVYLQWLLTDPSAPQGFTASEALELVLQ
ncbi:MAG: cytochrome c peroxidase [Planctomycetota bacterium]|jgi:cytochrome c peroxidase|nr:cytochrome c peroxidase [Planctomycetota bacterium]MDP6942257.1 cytochrome c peroxidase [Planctomycetota bacterium]